MAKIEDLISRVVDEHLREALVAEVRELKKTKRFGLVFEEHLPESVRLPNVPVRKGCHVARKVESENRILEVISVKGKTAYCRPEGVLSSDKDLEAIPVADLVVVKHFGEPIFPTLTPIDRIARGGRDKPWHALINADNFHALQLLLYTHERQVDVIYIDPPYNSGARDWKYNNDYVDQTDSFRHSKWLSMMKKRLKLAKRLLCPNGVLIVTIDENEVSHLSVLLSEVFPEYLRHMVTIVINPKGAGKLNFGRTEEHALFCVPATGENEINGNYVPDLATKHESEPVVGKQVASEKKQKNALLSEGKDEVPWGNPFPREEADLWELRYARRRGAESSYRHQRPNQFYPLYIDEEKRIVVRAGDSIPADQPPDLSPVDNLTPLWPIDAEGNHRCWRFITQSMQKCIEDGLVVLGRYNAKTSSWSVNIWYRKPEKKRVKTVWWHTRHDAGTHGTTLLHNILGVRAAFPFPKSVYAVADTLATVVGDRPRALILDFFAGSGTTFHAVSLLNARLGGTRRAVLISNNEPGEKVAKRMVKQGLFPGDEKYEAKGICESVTWPRCRYVIQGHRANGTPLPGAYLGTDADGKKIHMADGFKENLEYFRLDFTDSAKIERGDAFEGILPILWLMAGCIGARENRRGARPYYIPKHSPFAVLIREMRFREFQEKLVGREDITYIFLVTDSEENFIMMRRELGGYYQCMQLYNSYLENFRINTADATLVGKGGRSEDEA